MKELFILIKSNLKILIIKKPVYTLLMVLLPVIVSLIMFKFIDSSDNTKINIGISGNSNSFTANEILKPIKDNDFFNIITIDDPSDIDASIAQGSINAAIVFDDNFEKNILNSSSKGIELKGIDEDKLYNILNKYIKEKVSNLVSVAGDVDGNYEEYQQNIEDINTVKLDIDGVVLADKAKDYSKVQMVIGFMIMFAFYRAMNGAALISEDKEQHIYTRIISAAIKPWQYYLGNIISILIMLIVFFALSIIGMNLVISTDIGISNIKLLIVFIFTALVAVSIGTACITITKDDDLSTILSSIILIANLALGGCFVPLNKMSGLINKISYFTPVRWSIESISSIQQNASAKTFYMCCMILLAFSVFFFLISIVSINRRDIVDA